MPETRSSAGAPPIRVMIVDDHPVIIEGVAALVATQPDMVLAGQAGNGLEAVETFRTRRPDIVLMDLQLPRMSGLEAIVAIRAQHPAARIIALTTYRGDAQALRVLEAGARGYLLKTALRAEFATAIREVHAGRRWIAAEIAIAMAEHVAGDALSAREIEVLRGVSVGQSNKSIATELRISADTVKAHLKSILAKLDANDRTHAVTIAVARGILQLN